MPHKKSSNHEIDTDKLLEALEQSTVTKEDAPKIDYSSIEIADYFNFFGIKSGSYNVTGKVLYLIYKNWKADKSKMYSYNEFISEVNNYLPPIKSAKVNTYRINRNAFKLSEEAIIELNKNEIKKKNRVKKFFARTKHFDTFAQWLGLSKGNDPIRSLVVFYFYDYWSYTYKKKNLGMYNLIDFLSNKFKNKRTSKERYLLIDKSMLNTTEETLLKAQGWAEAYGKRKSKKRSSKKDNQENQEVV